MNFEILTLVDITETKQHRGPDKLAVSQQANFNTVIQTIGLRVNPVPIRVESVLCNIDTLGFGTSYKGEHNCWKFLFANEYQDGLNLEMMQQDFHLVPIIAGLTETVEINTLVFDTHNKKEQNIIFNYVD